MKKTIKKKVRKLSNGGIVNPYSNYNKPPEGYNPYGAMQTINGNQQSQYMNSADYNTGASVYGGVLAGAQAIPGTVGLVATGLGIVDQITKPFTERAERMDETGQFINEKAAKSTYAMTSLVNPFKSASYWAGQGKVGNALLASTGLGNLFLGKAYAKEREKDEAERIAKEAAELAIKKDKARIGFDSNRAQNAISTQPTALYAKGTDNIKQAGKMRMQDNSRLRRIGNGYQVDAQNAGKDTVPMNVNGQQVMVDNKEILLPRHDGGMAVISDDNGEATKYRKEIATGRNPNFTASKFIARAGMLKNKNTTNKLAGGTPDIPPTMYNDGTTDYDRQYNILPDFLKYKQSFINNGYNPIELMTNNNRTGIRVNPTGLDYKTKTRLNGLNDIKDYTITNPNMQPKNKSKFGEFIKKNNTKNNINTAIDIAGVALTAFQNQQAMNKLKNIPIPELTLNPYSSLNADSNKSVFDNMRAETLSQQARLDKGILENTANSNTALAMKALNKSGSLENLAKISSQQLADRQNIENANTQGMNRYSEFATELKTNFDRYKYQDEINLINTQLGLNASTLDSVQNVRQLNMTKDFNKERLDVISKTYGVDMSSPKSIRNTSIDKLIKMLESNYLNVGEKAEIRKEMERRNPTEVMTKPRH